MTADNVSVSTSHLSHLTYSPLIAPPHRFYYLSSLWALGSTLAMACTEKAEYNHYNHNKITVVFFIVLGELQFSVWMETFTNQTTHGVMCHAGSSAQRVTGRHVTSH